MLGREVKMNKLLSSEHDLKTSVSGDKGSATSRSVDSISPCICIPRSKMTNRPPYGLVDEKIWIKR